MDNNHFWALNKKIFFDQLIECVKKLACIYRFNFKFLTGKIKKNPAHISKPDLEELNSFLVQCIAISDVQILQFAGEFADEI